MPVPPLYDHHFFSEDRAAHPVFVVGMGRSGTTLLRLILNAHPELAMLSETWWGTRVWDRRWGFPMQDPVEPFRTRLLDSFIGLLDNPDRGDFPLDFARYRSQVLAGPAGLDRFLSALGDVWAQTEGKPRWGEKTPVHIWQLPVLHKMFPNMRALHIVRDPRATVASLIEAPFTKLTDPLALAWDWSRSVARALELEPQLPLTTVRYEDLVSSPEAAVRAVCRAADLVFDPGMLDHSGGADRYVPRQPWMGNLRRPLSTSRVRRWREVLSADDVLHVEAATAGLMRRLGYDPESPRRALRKMIAVTERLEASQRLLAEEDAGRTTDLVSMQRGTYRDLLSSF